MSIIQDRTNEVASLMMQVKEHHMCARFVDEGTSYLVIYPYGDWPVDGTRVRHDVGKVNALRKMIEKMEEHYKASCW